MAPIGQADTLRGRKATQFASIITVNFGICVWPELDAGGVRETV